jgi:late competence protein required for DNA uptake (superfamily II DNA/RNA helicase)
MLQEHKHIWIKKATGLGITEFMLRYMVWLCLRNNDLNGKEMCIVTGPRIDLAITLIDRMKILYPIR